ncbi:nuclear transport factor 2 family protein [Mycobacterium manitobense]|uniref:Nuclear transport factor 2 family protein n=1 Tax=[Mycobacterium] manitobense TaxID=190147 RepID=A0A9X2YK55_9MYCO|nr:nuclear transport factor 2 family protein [[Mycobacterium] manitobense]MCV7169438.1 nuclear transport factor 2 family protein [[Mycobacterium] manitobense]
MTTTPEDFLALTNAKGRYCYTLDTRDWAGFGDLMTDDMELDVSDGGTGVPVITGRDAAVDMIRSSLTNARSAHQVHTPLIEVDGDEATVVWAMQDRVVWENGPALTGYGHYHERWVRQDGAWRIKALRLTRLIMEFTTPGS